MRRRWRPLFWAMTGAATLATALLIFSLGQRRAAQPLVNPIPPTPESVAIGQSIYRAHCEVCHGVSGRGDGPAAAALDPPPADFRIHMLMGHTDAQFFRWITDGIPGLEMPPFRDRLTVEQRWHVLNFIQKAYTPVAE